MVYWPVIDKMENRFKKNLEQYVKEHPGEFALIETDKTTIYKTQEEVDEVTSKKRRGLLFLVRKIPTNAHMFDQNKKTLEFIDKYVTVCPNDGETELLGDGCIISEWGKGEPRYQERAVCPDCGYQVFRRPDDETIRTVEKNRKRMII